MPDRKQRLAEASGPAAEAMRLHQRYRCKIQMMPKCPIHGRKNFAARYMPGVEP